MDLGIEVTNVLLSKKGLHEIFKLSPNKDNISTNAHRIFALRESYINTINEIIAFLQGKNQTLARVICSGNFLPQAGRFQQLDDMEWAFGSMGIQDKAKYLSTLYLEDIADYIKECVDENFGFSRYAERLGRSANSFDELYQYIENSSTYIDAISWTTLKQNIESINPQLICFTVPFPGNLYSAFKMAKNIKSHNPEIKTAMGGGFANTELRSLSDIRVFDYFDYITLDDGELPIELLHSNITNNNLDNSNLNLLKRTFIKQEDKVVYNNFSLRSDYKQADLGTPDYSDLLLDKYISVIEVANPMHSLWSDGRWNKLTMAHGCYWGKCTFCDISLDYIKNYEPLTAKLLVDRMEEMIAQTGENNFHFVDEAAPPALMRSLALEILARNIKLSWWTNIRFEKSFTYDLCRLLAASGCIAVSGGLEVASNRLLELIQKGVTVEQVAQVTRNFTETGIMVHSYLMYAYPTQTVQETIDSLEMVRQLFELGIIQSGFWHQFALTAHSPVGINPEKYKITAYQNEITFANNDIAFEDSTGIDHNVFSFGLKKSLFNYMHGICFDHPLQNWFDFEIPETTISPNFIEACLEKPEFNSIKETAKVIWLGEKIKVEPQNNQVKMTFHNKIDCIEITMDSEKGAWLSIILNELSYKNDSALTFGDVKRKFETQFDDFTIFWYSNTLDLLKDFALLVV